MYIKTKCPWVSIRLTTELNWTSCRKTFCSFCGLGPELTVSQQLMWNFTVHSLIEFLQFSPSKTRFDEQFHFSLPHNIKNLYPHFSGFLGLYWRKEVFLIFVGTLCLPTESIYSTSIFEADELKLSVRNMTLVPLFSFQKCYQRSRDRFLFLLIRCGSSSGRSVSARTSMTSTSVYQHPV